MNRYRRKRTAKRAAVLLLLAAASPFLYRGAQLGLPYLSDAAERAAVWSAGWTLPEGGRELLAGDASFGAEAAGEPMPAVWESAGLSLPPSPASSAESAGNTENAEETEEAEPARPADAGTIVRKQYRGTKNSIQFRLSGGGWVKNLTEHTPAEIEKAVAAGPAFRIAETGDPQVLIMHTHTTESYESRALDWYEKGKLSRTTDPERNVCRVGDEIEKQLADAGIGVIHDRTLHDHPTFPGCYDRSAVTVKDYLEKYPSIKVVLDVHRDAIAGADGTWYAPVVSIDGKNAAQVMIISGCDDGTMGYPDYLQNLKFAGLLQNRMEADYPGLARPLLFDYRKYNQHLTTGSILLEMGGHANSLDEAVYAGELVGKSLARALLSIRE